MSVAELTREEQVELLALGTVITLIEDGAQNLEAGEFDDTEIELLLVLKDDVRMTLTARLIELAESVRESLRTLDGRVLQLTSGQDS